MKPDESFLAWVAARTNGSNVHDSNMLRCNYIWFCEQGDTKMAEKTKDILTAFLTSGKEKVRQMIGVSRKPMLEQFEDWKKETK